MKQRVKFLVSFVSPVWLAFAVSACKYQAGNSTVKDEELPESWSESPNPEGVLDDAVDTASGDIESETKTAAADSANSNIETCADGNQGLSLADGRCTVKGGPGKYQVNFPSGRTPNVSDYKVLLQQKNLSQKDLAAIANAVDPEGKLNFPIAASNQEVAKWFDSKFNPNPTLAYEKLGQVTVPTPGSLAAVKALAGVFDRTNAPDSDIQIKTIPKN